MYEETIKHEHVFFSDTTFSSIPKPCYCPQPWQQTTYDVRVSYALFPSEETGSFMESRLGVSHFLFHIFYSFLIVSYTLIIHPWKE